MPLPTLDARHVLALMGFLSTASEFMSRADLSIAIVAMVGGDSVNMGGAGGASGDSACSAGSGNGTAGIRGEEEGEGNTAVVVHNKGEFDWDPKVRGDLLGSYYYGNALTQILAGWMAMKFGFKKVVGVGLFVCSILSLLTPAAAVAGFWHLMVCRCLLGFFHGFIFTPIHGAWSIWSPPHEYSWLVSFPMAGCSLGTVLIFPLGGLLGTTVGWRSIFYTTGGFNLALAVAWWLLVFDRPETHPRISPRERDYILASQKESGGREEVGRTPWRAILTSGPVWGVIIPHWAGNWGTYQIQTLLPTYLSDILGLDLFSNGCFTALPYLVQAVVIFAAGHLTDFAVKRGHVATLTMRRLCNALGLLVPAAAVVVAGYAGCNVPVAVAAFVASATFTTFVYFGFSTNIFDFAPRYAPMIYGISNTFGQAAGFMAPQTTGLLLSEGNSRTNWMLSFWVSALVYLPGFLAFQFLSTDRVQPWALGENDDGDGDDDDSGDLAEKLEAGDCREGEAELPHG